MSLPEMTHLQYEILQPLLDGKCSGREIRAYLAARKIKKSGPAFYQLMARLEEAKFVRGWYDEKVIDGQRIKERKYEILAGGVKACQQTFDFYQARNLKAPQGGWANA